MSADVIRDAEALAAAGSFDDALAMLRSAPRRPEVEAALLRVRHAAFDQLRAVPAGPGPGMVGDLYAVGTTIPEIDAAALTAEGIASALQHHGSLLVRGLVSSDRAASLREAIDDAFAGAAAHRADPDADTAPGLVPFEPDERYPFGIYERAFANFGSGVLGVDSPRAMFEMTEALDAAGIRRVFGDYFGEPPAFSVKKTTLRRTQPDAPPGWHQDGAFLGTDTRALNIWTELSPCGIDAPGLDVFARNFDHLVPTGGDEIYDWSVSNDTASTYDLANVVRPVFDTGDALIFDHMTLHRTGVDATMTKTRYAIEMWFFAPSTYPIEQIPIAF